MVKVLSDQISIITQEFERVTGQRCYFLPMDNSNHIDNGLSEGKCPNFCLKVSKSATGNYLCGRKRQALIASAISRREPVFFICHAGLYEIMVPLFSGASAGGVLNAVFKPVALPDIIFKQQHIYEQKYECDVKVLLDNLSQISSMDEKVLQSTAELLNALVMMHIHSKPLVHLNPEVRQADEVDEEEDIDLSELVTWPLGKQALSQLIEKNKDDRHAYQGLDEILETTFNLLFINIRNGYLAKAKELFKSIFNIVYLERDLVSQKRCAQFLIYKCNDVFLRKISFVKEVYDRTNIIGDRIFLAQSSTELRIAAGDYFDALVQIYQLIDINKDPLVNRIIRFINKHYDCPFTVKDMVKSLNVSFSYASRIFTERMGVSIKWYINELRMYNAQYYLRHTDLPISTVASKVGYADVRSFYKMYSKHYSISCSKLRNLYTNGKNRINENY